MITEKIILDNIRKIRELKGFSQEYVASELNIKQSAYNLIENGNRKLTIDKLLQIAICFDVSPVDIITYSEKIIAKKEEPVKAILHIELQEEESKYTKPLQELSDRELLEYLFFQNKILHYKLETIMKYLSESKIADFDLEDLFHNNREHEEYLSKSIRLQEVLYNYYFVNYTTDLSKKEQEILEEWKKSR